MRLSRRDFLKLTVASGVAAALPLTVIEQALAGNGDLRVIWLQGQSCSACSISLLNTINLAPIDDILLNKINLEYHSNLIASAGDLAIFAAGGPHPNGTELKALQKDWTKSSDNLEMDLNGDGKVNFIDYAKLCSQGYILVVEGAIPTGAAGHYCHVGGDMTMEQAFDKFSEKATSIITIGTCAAFGGIPASYPNPTDAKSVDQMLQLLGRQKPVYNIPGCPSHPDWFVGTLIELLAGRPVTIDSYKRPTAYFGNRIHQSGHCPYFGQTQVSTLGEKGCLKELGCSGIRTYADCYSRKWNSPGAGQTGVNWCIEAGSPCIGCTEWNFPDAMTPFHEF